MSDPAARKAGRTFALCLIAELGMLAVSWYAINKEAPPLLLLVAGVVVGLPTAQWITGKGWKSLMDMLPKFGGRE